MDAPSNGNLFDSIEPHRHLPDETRAALWAACERVRNNRGEFADVVAWLDRDYSEAAVCKKKLEDSRLTYLRAFRAVVQAHKRFETFPRRKALRHGTPHQTLVLQTIEDASGMVLRGDQLLGTNNRQEGDVAVDAGNVEMAWQAADEKCRQFIRHIKDERRERDAGIREEVKKRMGRFLEAVRYAVECDIPAVNRVECSRRLVLLAAMIASPEPISLSAEFADMPWETQGNELGLGGPYVPGREILFEKYDLPQGGANCCIANVGADAIGNLITRALNVVRANPTKEERIPAADASIHDDFKKLLEGLGQLIVHPTDENTSRLNREASALAEKCLANIASIRGGLEAREKLNAQWEDRLVGASSALSNLLASLSRVDRNGFTAPEADRDPEGAHLFDTARSTLTLFNDKLKGVPADGLSNRAIEGVGASPRGREGALVELARLMQSEADRLGVVESKRPEAAADARRAAADNVRDILRRALAVRAFADRPELPNIVNDPSSSPVFWGMLGELFDGQPMSGNEIPRAGLVQKMAAEILALAKVKMEYLKKGAQTEGSGNADRDGDKPGAPATDKPAAGGGAEKVIPSAPMTRQEAQKRALKYVEANGWPDSQRKLAEVVVVSRPLLDDMPGIERYKKIPAPKAATQLEAEIAGEVAGDNSESDPAVACAYEENRHRVMSCLDESQKKSFEGLTEAIQKGIVEQWDDWPPEKRKEVLRYVAVRNQTRLRMNATPTPRAAEKSK